jgi:O-antigen/teichoic acid export membrane protein
MIAMTKKVDVHGGTVWTMIWWGVKLSLKFASNIILTRLLTPDMFGISAIGNAVMSGINLFSDFGVGQSVIRSRRIDDHYLQTAWTIQLLRGLGIALIVMLLAKPVAWFYHVDGLATFLLIVAASNVSMGLNNIGSLLDYRHAMLRKIAINDMVAAVVGLGAMVLWAWISPSYIALAVGSLVSTTVFMLGTYFAYPKHNYRFRFEKETIAEMVGFGKWVMISTILGFATMQMDRMALGRMVTMHVLGFYAIAMVWASTPNQILEQWASRVFFPLVSQYVRNDTDLKTIWSARRLYVLLSVVSASVMYATSDIIVTTLYTLEYHDISLYIRQLSIVFLLYSIENSYSHVLIAHGRPREKVIGQLLSVILFGVALLPVFYWADISGVIALLAVSSGMRIIWMAYRLFTYKLAELWYDFLAVVIYFPIAMLLHYILGFYDNRWYQISAAFIAGMASLVIALVAYRRLRRICESA